MTLHPDAVCKYLLKEYTLPNNWLNDIYTRQKDLQNFINRKRNKLAIPQQDEQVTPEHIYESLYHYTCMMMEMLEFKTAPNEAEKDFEYIDVLFFLCNVGIFSGVQKVFYIEKISEEKLDNLLELFNDTILKFLDSLPFKKWKTYKSEDYNVINFELETYNLALNYWIAYGIYELGYNEHLIYNLYRSKLEENKNRQIDKSKGYI